MTTKTAIFSKLTTGKFFRLGVKDKRILAGYIVLLFIPFLISLGIPMASTEGYTFALGAANILAMMAFFVQFPLGSRIKNTNIDWNMATHKRIGQWIGVFFLLHPLLILAPRFIFYSGGDWVTSFVETITAPQMLSGVIAWVVMIIWVLASIFKAKLPMSYETWRLTHMVGFVIIAIQATRHITTVGSHGQFQSGFNTMWWFLCCVSIALVIYNYLIKPLLLSRSPFKLTGLVKRSSRDWEVTLEVPENVDFTFEAGQFVWLNSSRFAGNLKDHPFSIASCKSDLPKVSFIIRELGDYTSKLNLLNVGQNVFVDGPYGCLSLKDSRQAKGITLIAGGCGVGPILSLLRELAAQNDPRPIRLLYGNNSLDQMVLLDEIRALEQQMPDFRLQLVCAEKTAHADIYQGIVNEYCIGRTIDSTKAVEWAVYLCGPKPMISGVNNSLQNLGVSSANVHYEQLAY